MQTMADHTSRRRRSSRAKVLLVALLDLPDRSEAVKLRNLSEEGALVEGAGRLDENCELVFRRNDLAVSGRVIWVRGELAGISFNEPLDRKIVLRHVPVAAARAVPPEMFRRPSVTRHAMTAEQMRWIDDWMQSVEAQKPGE